MRIEFLKTHPDARLPEQNNQKTDGTADTGYDLYAVENVVIPGVHNESNIGSDAEEHLKVNGSSRYKVGSAVVPVGLEVAFIEPGYWFRIEGRSGLGFKYGVQPHFGIIDNQYRGDLGVKLYNLGSDDYIVSAGDKIAQMVFYPLVEAQMKFADAKQETDRGEKGFGSSGK
jgi:dUTP pyrophosphatase